MLSARRPKRGNEERGCALLRSLYDREINGTKSRSNVFKATYNTLTPNYSIVDVDLPPLCMRSFSPDGRHFLAFSNDLTCVEVYNYLGCSMAVDLLKNFTGEYIEENFDDVDVDNIVRNQIFKRLFRLKYRVKVCPEREQLVKTCSLFTKNGRHALVVSSTFYHPSVVFFPDQYMSLSLLSPVEDYTIHLVDFNLGSISDKLCIKSDKIYFNYNFGFHIYNDTLAVLSIRQQTIDIYDIIHDKFNLICKVGQFHHNDGFHLTPSVPTFEYDSEYKQYMENRVHGLKQKLMMFMYNKAEHEIKTGISKDSLKIFYDNFNELLVLHMWRVQLLDENILLIRYASKEVATLKFRNPNQVTHTEHFMFYDMTTDTVLNVLDNESLELLKMYENFCDDFRNPSVNPDGFIPTSTSNNIFARKVFNDTLSENYKVHGQNQTLKVVLNNLPIVAQSITSSPYLDQSIFMYNDSKISTQQLPIKASNCPIRFLSRHSKSLKFSLITGRQSENPLIENPLLRWVTSRNINFIFHPTDPFAISIVKEHSRHNVNFHIRQVSLPEE